MISLGLMEAFSRYSSRVGYFRPVVASGPGEDNTIDLIRRRYGLAQTYEQSYGITTERTHNRLIRTGTRPSGNPKPCAPKPGAPNLDADPDVEYFFGSDCDPSRTLQLIKIEVRSTNGHIIESVEIVK